MHKVLVEVDCFTNGISVNEILKVITQEAPIAGLSPKCSVDHYSFETKDFSATLSSQWIPDIQPKEELEEIFSELTEWCKRKFNCKSLIREADLDSIVEYVHPDDEENLIAEFMYYEDSFLVTKDENLNVDCKGIGLRAYITSGPNLEDTREFLDLSDHEGNVTLKSLKEFLLKEFFLRNFVPPDILD